MGPALTPAAQAQIALADPTTRAQILTYHQQNMPFLDMIDALKIPGFDGALRDAIAGLGDDEVAIIRAAMVAAIERAGDTPGSCFPIACTVGAVTGPVTVSAIDKGGEPWAQILPTPGK